MEQDATSRVARLERQLRRLKQVVWILVACVAVVCLVAQGEPAEAVVTRAVEIRDGGVLRARLGVERGATVLALFDKDGTKSILFEALGNGAASMRMGPKARGYRVDLMTSGNGTELVLSSHDGKDRIALTATPTVTLSKGLLPRTGLAASTPAFWIKDGTDYVWRVPTKD